MASFKFNFDLEENSDHESTTETKPFSKFVPDGSETSQSQAPPSSSAMEIHISEFHWSLSHAQQMKAPCVFQVPNSTLKLNYINTKKFDVLFQSSDSHSKELGMDLQSLLQVSESQHSDLIPGVYEGGLKVWECTFDVIQYFEESNFNFLGLKVLELGCGVGLPAIYALIKGASQVCFQDYNAEVINYVTIPSVLKNLSTKHENEAKGMADCDSEHTRCRFYSGDWGDFTQLVTSGSCDPNYDVIITSETIYSERSQPKLLSTMKRLLNPKTGIVFVAAKSYYFGVGGSTAIFEELVKKDSYFNVKEVKTVESNVPRKILKLSPKIVNVSH